MYLRKKNKISIIGLGYVGLPLAIEFNKYHNVIGYDINQQRIFDLNNFLDINNEMRSININFLPLVWEVRIPSHIHPLSIFYLFLHFFSACPSSSLNPLM